MPLLSVARFFTILISLTILGITIYLAWTWYAGRIDIQDGYLVQIREDWRLWAAAILLAYSFLGRFLLVPLLARPDRGERSVPDRGDGHLLPGLNGSRLYVEDVGSVSQPTVILTHGWAMDSTIWHYAKKDLGSRFRLIVWDLPGLGRSEGEISLENFAQNLGTIIRWSGAEKVVLVGHSIGGMTIQTLARDHPELFGDRVAGAVLFNTTYLNPLKTMIASRLMQAIRYPLIEPIMRVSIALQPLVWIMNWQSHLSGLNQLANRLGFGKYVTHSQLNHVSLLSITNSSGNIDRGNLAMFRWNATGALSQVHVPVLLLAGDMDIVTKPQASEDIAAQAQIATVRRIEGANHMGMLECAALYNAAVADFALTVLPPPGEPGADGPKTR